MSGVLHRGGVVVVGRGSVTGGGTAQQERWPEVQICLVGWREKRSRRLVGD